MGMSDQHALTMIQNENAQLSSATPLATQNKCETETASTVAQRAGAVAISGVQLC